MHTVCAIISSQHWPCMRNWCERASANYASPRQMQIMLSEPILYRCCSGFPRTFWRIKGSWDTLLKEDCLCGNVDSAWFLNRLLPNEFSGFLKLFIYPSKCVFSPVHTLNCMIFLSPRFYCVLPVYRRFERWNKTIIVTFSYLKAVGDS